MSARLKDALSERRLIEHEISAALAADYPVGAAVRWSLTGRVFEGVIVRNCYGDRVEVENTRTHRRRFITASDIVRAIQENA